jgi:hypothetical protein
MVLQLSLSRYLKPQRSKGNGAFGELLETRTAQELCPFLHSHLRRERQVNNYGGRGSSGDTTVPHRGKSCLCPAMEGRDSPERLNKVKMKHQSCPVWLE